MSLRKAHAPLLRRGAATSPRLRGAQSPQRQWGLFRSARNNAEHGEL